MTQPLTISIFGIPSVGDIVKKALSGIVETVLKQVLKFVTEALTNIMEAVYSSFLKVDTFGVGGSDADPFNQSGSFVSVASFTNTHVLWLSAAIATVSIAIAGGRLLWNYAHGYHEGLKAILSGLAIMVIVNLLVIQAVRVAVWIGDRYTEWILEEAHYKADDSWTNNLADSGAALLLLLCVSGLVVLSMIVQFIIMIFRSAILVILAGTIVLPASAATTETGRKWLNKYIAWMLAFICMKPAAATVYAVAFRLIEEPGDGGWDKMTAAMAGMVLLGAAVFVMPAMLRLLTPVGVAIGGAMSGGDSGSPGGPPQQQPDGSSEPAAPRGSQSSSSGGGGGGIEGGPTGASSAETGASKAATSGMGSGGTAAGGGGGAAAAGGGTAAATEGAAVAAAPETMGASLAVGAAVGAAQAGKQAFEQAVTQGAEEAGSADGSSGPVGSSGGGVDLG